MNRLRDFWKLLGKIILRFSARERIIVLLLMGVIIASSLNLIFGKTQETIIEIKGVYTEGLVGTPRLLNPALADFNDVDRDISHLIFSGLMKYDPAQRNFFSDLADYELSEDHLTYTFVIKENVKWHDGKPFTADDVYFTYHDIIQDAGFKNPILKSTFQGVTVQKIDERSISFTLKEPNSFFISNMIVGIVPKHLLEDVPVAELDKAPFNSNPVGTGPYKIDNTPTSASGKYQNINLVRFDGYYAAKPSLSRMRFIFYPDWKTLLAEKDAQSGIARVDEKQWEEYLADDDRFTRFKYRLPQYTALFFNQDNPLLANRSLRLALITAVDRDSLVSLLGSKQVVDTITRQRTESRTFAYSREEAEAILDKLGWVKGSNGFRSKDGIELSFRLIGRKFADNPPLATETKQTVDFLRNGFEAVGARIQVQLLDKDEMLAAMENRTYDMLLAGHNLGYNSDTYSFWHSSQTGKTGLNLSNVRDFKIDSLLEDLRATFDLEKKWQKLDELAVTVAEDIAAFILYTPEYGFAIDKKYTGWNYEGFASHSDRFANIAHVTLVK